MRTPRSLSEHRPIQRSLTEKRQQLRDLKETLNSLKPQTTPALRQSIERRMHELTIEIRHHAQPKERKPPRTKERIYAIYSD